MNNDLRNCLYEYIDSRELSSLEFIQCFGEKLWHERCGIVIQALQEKSEREKGCEYCKERKPILNELGELQIDDIDGILWFTSQVAADDIYEEHTKINYCPMCGRKLVEE